MIFKKRKDQKIEKIVSTIQKSKIKSNLIKKLFFEEFARNMNEKCKIKVFK